MPRLFPIITDVASVLELFTVVPVLVTAYTCHYNVYLLTSFFGFLLFGEGTLDDVLANFDTDLGIPFGSVLNDAASCACISSCLLCSARQPR
ncbi:Amino acid transporter AVT6B [Glycine soja]